MDSCLRRNSLFQLNHSGDSIPGVIDCVRKWNGRGAKAGLV